MNEREYQKWMSLVSNLTVNRSSGEKVSNFLWWSREQEPGPVVAVRKFSRKVESATSPSIPRRLFPWAIEEEWRKIKKKYTQFEFRRCPQLSTWPVPSPTKATKAPHQRAERWPRKRSKVILCCKIMQDNLWKETKPNVYWFQEKARLTENWFHFGWKKCTWQVATDATEVAPDD